MIPGTKAEPIRVNDLYPCIQGEGVLTGIPMVLIRLHGCSVGCAFCDTKETWRVDEKNRVDTLKQAQSVPEQWVSMLPEEVAREAALIRRGIGWALITGGEPADQDLKYLSNRLINYGFTVALETSGTAPLGEALFHWICVSPKLSSKKLILPEVINQANEMKMVIGSQQDVVKLLGLLRLASFKGQICLQPMSTQREATELCIKMCQEMGWRLSLQTQKFIGQR